ncbi:mitochondrial ribosomal subunit S27-domain-containing protein [Amylocarpus encephaloides]|uniref:Small ribosomal subunit protein mS33 n=1 Tax=Amylocarpus encephaloides TaxID=45428 RepID=A0A9P8C5K9_9HELO|nr:mitochondrial ribosomal subunit S27-domain-containing protein [Amylocarpus encephaloides]
MAVPRSRILDLIKVQCRIFSHTFNPEGARLGNKVLRQRLKGPALAAYYPRKMATFKDLQKAYPQWETYDEEQEDRLEALKIIKARGKGAPKKKRTAAESKKFKGKKRAAAVAAA